MTQQNPGSYNWGAPSPANGAGQPQPAQPAQPGQPQQPQFNKPAGSGGVPTILKVALTILVVLALAFAGLWIFQKLRPSPTGPLGWDEETLVSKLDGGQLDECELGSDFFDSVGVKDVAKDSYECTGTTASADGSDFEVTLNTSSEASSDGKSPKDADLSAWKESADGFDVPDEVQDLAVDTYGPGQKCTMSSSQPMFKKVKLSTNGPCAALYPMARQLNNLQTQYDWERTDHGMFDFDSPEFLEVKAEPQSLVVPVYKQAKEEAKAFGDKLEIEDDDYEGTTFTITGGNIAGSQSPEVCVVGDVQLGKKTGEYAYNFHLPNRYVALFPNGQRVSLNAKDYPIRLKEGESKKGLRFCSSYTPEVASSEFVIFVGDSTGGPHATWVIQDGGGDDAKKGEEA